MNPTATPKPAPKSAIERQRAFRERAKTNGLKRMPAGYMSSDIAAMVDTLIKKGYAPSMTAVFHRAVSDMYAAHAESKQ